MFYFIQITGILLILRQVNIFFSWSILLFSEPEQRASLCYHTLAPACEATTGLLTPGKGYLRSANDKEALLHLRGYSGVKRNQWSASSTASKWDQERGASCLLWHMLAFVRGNAEEEKSRVGEGSLCLWRGRRGSDIPLAADGEPMSALTGASVASFHARIRRS